MQRAANHQIFHRNDRQGTNLKLATNRQSGNNGDAYSSDYRTLDRFSHVAKGGLTLVLCLIGASLSPHTLHMAGWKAAVQGMLLWVFISIGSLLLIVYGHAG